MAVENLLIEEFKLGDFSRNLRTLRALRGLRQRELAARSGVERSTIGLLERGHHKPQAATAEKLAGALEVSVETLTGHRLREEG